MRMDKTLRTLALAAVSAHWMGAGWAETPREELPEMPAEDASGLRVFHHENVLGTSLELKVRAKSAGEAARAERAVLREIDRCDGILSAWKPESEFSRWMKTRGTVERVSPELMEVMSLFEGWREQTGGALDASAETAARLWQEAALRGSVPSREERSGAVRAMQTPHWKLDRVARTAVHLDAAPLALNSFAKSYIADRAAQAALHAGATGVMLNLGGDLVTRGALRETVGIADPRADAENDAPMDRVRVANRAVATSGGYRRGIGAGALRVSHLFDPRTAEPASEVLSATVIAPEASEAGALATAFSVMQPGESAALAGKLRGVEYLLVMADGRRLASAGWEGYRYGAPSGGRLVRTAYVPQARKVAAPAMDLMITLELARISDPRYRRPYVAVWVEDKDRFPVRTVALWFAKPRWLPELKSWYRDDQVRALAEGTDLSGTISSATRAPGKYTLRWDGKDDAGKPVKPGRYTVCVEVTREHGTRSIVQKEIDFDGKTAMEATLPPSTEIAGVTLDYGAHGQ